ncbi:hypothetical protein NCS56_01422000 [Fusarium sp. Ph1]|nr:hypothetical protein NCS56_01422000 [Fusarium sp. Ph1]
MAANTKDGFTRALDSFRNTLTPEQRDDFSFNTLQDVQASVKNIQDRYGPEKKLRNMQRLSKFLDGMKQVEELVTIFLNVHEVVAFVWGPIKFALMIARNRLESLEVLLDTYVEIGEVIPSLRQYEQMFKNYPYLREVLERCFHDILGFHKEALSVFARTSWKKYFACAWNTFKTRCKPIIDSLKRHRALLSDEKLTAAVAEVQEGRREAQDFRDTVEARFSEISKQLETESEKRSKKELEEMKESLLQARRTISSQLSPGSYEADQQSAFSQFFSSPSGDWILKEPKFKEWLGASNGQILYMHGMPGAGKTTLVSRIINFLQSRKDRLNGPVLYFYFKSRQEDKRSMSGMLRALLNQLIHQDDSAADCVRQRWFSPSESDLTSLPVLKELVEDCLATPRGGTIVLDGLDECQDERNTCQEPRKIIDWIHKQLISEARSRAYPIRILVSSQHVDFLEKELIEHPCIRLDQDARHLRNIQAYVKSEAVRIQERFSFTDCKRDSIVGKVSDSSNGFFLYARVVLDNLMEQGSQSELDEELDTENFPENLEAAYERVVVRVLDQGSRSKKAAASKILHWITCAARPLYWREIQSRFCINPEAGQCIFANRRVDSCKVICSSLVEEEAPEQGEGVVQERVVRLVHSTAGRYLVHTGRVNLVDAHADMALFCSQYLASGPFQNGLRAETIEEFAKTGYYGLLDYAMMSWICHLSFISKHPSSLDVEKLLKVVSCAKRAFESYKIPKGELEIEDIDDIIKAWPSIDRKSPFESRIWIIRYAVESISVSELDSNSRSVLLVLNGVLCFKCPKLDCHNFAIGFIRCRDRDNHVQDHERSFKCLVGGCYAAVTGFRSESELNVHTRRCHPGPEDLVLFSNPKTKRPLTIFEACIKGDLKQVKALVAQGVNVNAAKSPGGQVKPLALAAKHEHCDICQFLIEKGAGKSFIRKSGGGKAVMDLAIKLNDYELFQFLICTASGKLTATRTLLDLIFSHIINALESEGDRSDEMFQRLLSICELRSFESVFRYLTQNELLHEVIQRTDSASKFEIALEWVASRSEQRSGVAISCPPADKATAKERYVVLTTDLPSGNSLLHEAAVRGRLSIVRFLLHRLKQQYVATVQNDGNTPLHLVSQNDDQRDMAELLVNADDGVSANEENFDGHLPIHVACIFNQPEIVRLLIDHTHDLNAKDSEGNTPLLCAAKSRGSKAARVLLETKKVDVLSRNHAGETLFDVVLQEADVGTLRLLRSHCHASVPGQSAVELLGGNPLEYCIKHQEWELLERFEKLLDYEVDGAWLEMTLSNSSPVPIETIHHLLSSGYLLAAKVYLASKKVTCSTHDLWNSVKAQEDDEVRVLLLLQGHFPQYIWQEHLPAIKKLLQDVSSASALLDLLRANKDARQALNDQITWQEDEELKESWSRIVF